MFVPDAADTVPIFQFGDDGRVRNIRPTIYHRNAQAQVKRHGSKGYLGYIVENNYGHRKPMTFKQYERMKNLEALGQLRVVDYWRDHRKPMEYGMAGYDTEMERSGLYEMPSFSA